MDSLSDPNRYQCAGRRLTRIMGLDVGQRRTGVALSDPTRLLARGLAVVEQTDEDWRIPYIVELVQAHDVSSIIVGYPLHMSGDKGEQAQFVDRYAEALADELARREMPVEIVLWDERYSTATAERILLTNKRTRKRRRDQLDAIAAAVILQEYLDRQRAG